MNATVMCEKCGKPLGVFDGNICNECENRAVLDKIRDEIKDEMDDITSGCVAKYSYDEGYYRGLKWTLRIIDKYREEQTDAT